jgi:hypothetical protein
MAKAGTLAPPAAPVADPVAMIAAAEAEAEKIVMGLAEQLALKPVDISDRQLWLKNNLPLTQRKILGVLGWDDRRIGAEVSRAIRLLSTRKRAGTPAEREEARQAFKTARENLLRERPRLEKILAETTAKLAQLERIDTEAEKVVNDQNVAVESLRELLPDSVIDKVKELQRQFQPTKQQWLAAKTRLREVDAVLGLSPSSDSAKHYGKRHGLLSYQVNGNRRLEVVNLAMWEQHKAELKKERPEVERRLAELQQLKDEHEANCRAIENAYLQP